MGWKMSKFMSEEDMARILADEEMFWHYPEKEIIEAVKKLQVSYSYEKEKNKKIEDKIKAKINQLKDYKDNFWLTGENDVAEDMDDYYELEHEINLLENLLREE